MTGEVFFDFSLDFGNVSMPKRLRLTQYSDRLPTLRAKLYNVGAAYTIPDGATVNVRWKKPSGTVVYNPVTSATGNVITYALDGQCASAAGICTVCFEITTGGKTAQTPVFPVEVVTNPVQSGDIEDSSALDALDQRIEDAAKQAQAGFDDAVERAKEEADRIASEAAADARESATRAEEAAQRAEAAAPSDGPVVSVNGMGGIVKLTAEKVPFDPTGTPFISTNVQDAIEELLSIGGGGGAISTITVTAPAGAEVTVSKGEKSYTQTVGEGGDPVIFRVIETGEWKVVAFVDGGKDERTVDVSEAGGSYSVEVGFSAFKAYIKVTAQDGAAVKVAKGDYVVSGTSAGGMVILTVGENGNWVVTATYQDGVSNPVTVNVLEEGQTYQAEAKFCALTVTAPAGSTIEAKNNDTTLTGTADAGSIKFWLPNTGTWTIVATLNGQTANTSVDCSAYQDYSAELAYFSATIKVTAVQGATVKAVLDSYSVSGEAGSGGVASLTVAKSGTYTVSATYGNVNSNTKSVQVNNSGQQYPVTVNFITLTVTAPAGSTVTVKNGGTTLSDTATGGTVKFYLPNTGTWSVTAELGVETASGTVNASNYQNYSIELAFIPDILNEATWKQISDLSKSGKFADYYDVGDTKDIVINGDVGSFRTYTDYNISAFVVGINHNSSVEGKNLVHFKIGKTGGLQQVLADSVNGSYGHGNGSFQNGSSYNGWVSCNIRNNIFGNMNSPNSPRAGTLMNALPGDLRNVMRTAKKYTYNGAEGVSSTDDWISLLSEYEFVGYIQESDSGEAYYQEQYQYYKSGNSRVHYIGSNPNWATCRSVGNDAKSWCEIDLSGGVSLRGGDYSKGLAPIFFV